MSFAQISSFPDLSQKEQESLRNFLGLPQVCPPVKLAEDTELVECMQAEVSPLWGQRTVTGAGGYGKEMPPAIFHHIIAAVLCLFPPHLSGL